MVMACEWIVNSMAILRGEKKSEKTRVEQPYSPWDFDIAIYSGDHNREGAGDGRMGDKRRLSFFFFFLSKPLQNKKQQQSRGRRQKSERTSYCEQQ